MKLDDIIGELDLEIKSGGSGVDVEISTGYVSDLMSDVIANAGEGALWVTMQVHINVVAVASMKSLAGIILVNGRQPEADTLAKAHEEKIPLFVSSLSAFEIVGKLYAMGLQGSGKA
jgi:hypothetical protein